MVLPSGFRDAPSEFSWRSRGAWIQFPPPFYSVADTDAWHSASGQPEVEAAAHPQTLKRINPRSRGAGWTGRCPALLRKPTPTGASACAFCGASEVCEVGSCSGFPHEDRELRHLGDLATPPRGTPTPPQNPAFLPCCLFYGCNHSDLVEGRERGSCWLPGAFSGPGRGAGKAEHQGARPRCLLLGEGRAEWSQRTQFLFVLAAGNFLGDIL